MKWQRQVRSNRANLTPIQQREKSEMKKAIVLAVLFLAVRGIPAFADIEGVAGAKLDMPDLVRINRDWTIGLESGKNLYNILPEDQSAWVEDDRGYFGYVKVTCKWTLLDFTKK